MKNLESKLFQKFENDKLENLHFVTGGRSWVKTFRNGNHVDSVDTDSYPTGGTITSADYFSGDGEPPAGLSPNGNGGIVGGENNNGTV